MNLHVHRLAVAEIDHEVDYYESRQAGLGSELEDELDAAFELLLRFRTQACRGRAVRIDARDRAVPVHVALSSRRRRHHRPRSRAHESTTWLLGTSMNTAGR